jgi:hypothetical protein
MGLTATQNEMKDVQTPIKKSISPKRPYSVVSKTQDKVYQPAMKSNRDLRSVG